MSQPNRFNSSTMMSMDRETALVADIRAAEQLWEKNPEELSTEDKTVLQRGKKATHELVRGYAPLIEKIAKERYAGVPAHRADLDDFISEAYIVALQCARTFNPTLGKKVIRFSSYFPRAVSSSLSRLAMRSRSIVSVPVQKMTEARKWSHTKFEMENLGISLSDQDISEISGVNSTQQEVMEILGVTMEDNIDDVNPPGVVDVWDEDTHLEQEKLTRAILASCSEYYGMGMVFLMGIATGQALITRFLLSVEIRPRYDEDYDVDTFLSTYQGYINHPIIRVRMREQLKTRKGR